MDGPIPMSFPTLLRGGTNLTFRDQRVEDSHLSQESERTRRAKINVRREGKQWVRRRENTQFTSNPHVAAPTARDMGLPIPGHRPAFPQPLPSYLKRNMEAPHWQPPISKASGRPSLRGMRKMFRGNGVHAEKLVQAFEAEILGWLHKPMLNQDNIGQQQHSGRLIGPGGKVREISQAHAELVWYIPEDAFARYILHSLAKFHCLVSFSKETPNGERFTHILRPRAQTIQADTTSLDTPPFTDLDSASDFTLGTPDIRSEASDGELDVVAEQSEGEWVHVGEDQGDFGAGSVASLVN
ncbi:hypothetical protein FRB98_009648, partial [Tulasnella sp. 332]